MFPDCSPDYIAQKLSFGMSVEALLDHLLMSDYPRNSPQNGAGTQNGTGPRSVAQPSGKPHASVALEAGVAEVLSFFPDRSAEYVRGRL